MHTRTNYRYDGIMTLLQTSLDRSVQDKITRLGMHTLLSNLVAGFGAHYISAFDDMRQDKIWVFIQMQPESPFCGFLIKFFGGGPVIVDCGVNYDSVARLMRQLGLSYYTRWDERTERVPSMAGMAVYEIKPPLDSEPPQPVTTLDPDVVEGMAQLQRLREMDEHQLKKRLTEHRAKEAKELHQKHIEAVEVFGVRHSDAEYGCTCSLFGDGRFEDVIEAIIESGYGGDRHSLSVSIRHHNEERIRDAYSQPVYGHYSRRD